MNKLYTYSDYEDAYYHMRYYDCKKIGLYLLSFNSDDKSKELYDKLSSYEYKLENQDSGILFDVKIWLMVNQPC